ncbi:MAG: thiol oxidoreductase-like protein [Planctomycetes bacterium]|nr:thiol oxidoreductase-like protein [Planctomycetota bacterium]
MIQARVRIAAPLVLSFAVTTLSARAQLTDLTQAPNAAGAGIQKSLAQEVGAGRGDVMTPLSSLYVIQRDPFRSIQRGRQLFQRKFTAAQGLGPRKNDGVGNIELDAAIGAGLADSCAACHSRPFGSAGVGGNVFTRPDSRDAPHLFGLGLQEMLADEITRDLRAIRTAAITQAQSSGLTATLPLRSKSISYGTITALANGTVDTSGVQGVNADLRVRPFFAQGKTITMREFLVGAFKDEMGLEAVDPDLALAAAGQDVVTPSGMLLSGSIDTFAAPPTSNPTSDGDHDGVVNEIPTSLVDSMEFYLLNYFKPGRGRETQDTLDGQRLMNFIGCTTCHVQDLVIDHDRRVADVETRFDPLRSNRVFNGLFATAAPLFTVTNDASGHPSLKRPAGGSFRVETIYTDFKRHDLGPGFHERNFDGSLTTQFMTEPLWGVGSTAPYGHDGRSVTLEDVILRHGGEAQLARDRFANLPAFRQSQILAFLHTLILFAPPDTASNLDPADATHPLFPQAGHGSIKLSVLFNDPNDKE